MSVDGENGTVRYTVKELFARIDSKLDLLAVAIDAKADHASVIALEQRVDSLEKDRDERSGSSRTQTAVIAILLAIAGMLVPIVIHVVQ